MTTHRDTWTAGTPAWADISVPDLAAARSFYGPLFGWTFEEGGPETGGYTQAFLDGRRVVGLAGPMEGQPPAPPVWCVYLATDDSTTTAQAIADAGGQTIVTPERILDFGTMGIFTDPTGAVFGTWEADTHTGWDVIDEPGAVAWSEHMSHDQSTGLSFYTKVFGYTPDDMSEDGFVYMTLNLDGDPVAGIGAYGPQGVGVPAAWTLYFLVESSDETLATVTDLGGTVVSPATDSPYGRMGIAQGLFGEAFAVIEPVRGS